MITTETIQLVQLGARANLVCQLTGLEKTIVKRLYRQLHGHPSPPGQMPYTDTWYLENPSRMLQAALVWRLYRRLKESERSAARVLIAVFESYTYMVIEPLLNFTRVAFVPHLITMKLWSERRCESCGTAYVSPVDESLETCPGCRRYYRLHRGG
ncbi:MAG: hypothetical protein GY807_19050 [Gammaproteobacteria bacterium]|nr:hypothetical protein [Gammaproteobacteria bacterium]